MVLPEGAAPQRTTHSTLVKALARAFRWKRMLEAGEFATIGELANHEEITLSYVTRILQLTRLAPDLIEAILSGKQAPILTAEALRQTLPDDWAAQRRMLERRD